MVLDSVLQSSNLRRDHTGQGGNRAMHCLPMTTANAASRGVGLKDGDVSILDFIPGRRPQLRTSKDAWRTIGLCAAVRKASLRESAAHRAGVRSQGNEAEDQSNLDLWMVTHWPQLPLPRPPRKPM
ncbi:GTP-binding protein [Platysternon megacephalum]|uniref:GTP-binding protein n=1 Tax=Platysternon megacephalum TaxID=55544 RepID=A0A4D9DE49_9SAUR|nr:GTP-binding protein [Platysternon megacephalum]